MKYPQWIVLLTLLCSFSSSCLGQDQPTRFTRVRGLQVGDATVEVMMRRYVDQDDVRWLLCNLHDDENTSVEAADRLLPEFPALLVELKHGGQREIAFQIDGLQYDCDPNRIFSPVGVKATIEKNATWDAEADRQVQQLGKDLIELYQLNRVQAVIALHNNTEDRYAASSYLPGQEYEKEAESVHIRPGSDPDDFFFVTERRFYDALVERGFNVVLQDNREATDDGSLSVYCGKRGVPYVNVEAQHGHLEEQVKMIRALLELLGEAKQPKPGKRRAELVDLSQVDATFVIASPYATKDNFVSTKLYPDNRLFLEKDAAQRLARVQRNLAAKGLRLKIFDGYRPHSVQKRMWEILPDPTYVADPAKGSRHNRGCAVDVTLVDSDGKELRMPTRFDEFNERAGHDFMDLPADILENRTILKQAMTQAGFLPLRSEWWHYDAPGWEQFEILDESPWDAPDQGAEPKQRPTPWRPTPWRVPPPDA